MPSPTAPAAASSTTTAGDATAAFGGETELEMLITDEGAMEEEGLCCASGAGVKSASAEGGAGQHVCAASAASNLSELRLCAPCSVESSHTLHSPIAKCVRKCECWCQSRAGKREEGEWG